MLHILKAHRKVHMLSVQSTLKNVRYRTVTVR